MTRNAARLSAAGAQLATIVQARRDASSTARRPVGTPRARLAPTQERLAKGDVLKAGGAYRSVPPLTRLLDQGKLSADPEVGRALYLAGERLRTHHRESEGALTGRDISRASSGTFHLAGLARSERFAQHVASFREARSLMGYLEHLPHHGNARIVIAVICEEAAVLDAAMLHIGPGNTAAIMGAAMDRLRQGLMTLALHWKFMR